MENRIKFLILTPCFQAAAFLPATFDSILLQAGGDVEITYMVCDGGSTDNTLLLFESFKPKFLSAGITFSYISERDFGMYDALAKGFLCYEKNIFDVYAYLNAGDRYAPRAFSKVGRIINSGVDWLTGINVFYNVDGDVIGTRLPGSYPRRLISVGLFGLVLPCIQQESTFWSVRAHRLINFDIFRKLKLAGDYYLWNCFAQSLQIRIVSVWLSGFTFHPGQLSEVRRVEYFQELRTISSRRNIFDYGFAFIIGLLWLLPDGLKKKIFETSYVKFDYILGDAAGAIYSE